jgi:hypothetical protein
MAIHGYVRPLPIAGGAGPAQFVVLAHRKTTTTNLTTLARHHEGFRANGFVSPSQNKLVTIAGSLGCRPEVGFAIFGESR